MTVLYPSHKCPTGATAMGKKMCPSEMAKGLNFTKKIQGNSTWLTISWGDCIVTTKAMFFLCGCDWYLIRKALAAWGFSFNICIAKSEKEAYDTVPFIIKNHRNVSDCWGVALYLPVTCSLPFLLPLLSHMFPSSSRT